MAETRKTDFLGESFGAWVVTARGESAGDRKRRWVVRNAESGVEMTVLQTDLKDLALAKTLAEKNAATDAARQVPGQMEIPGDRPEPPLSLEEAEEALLRRLDAQIDAARTEYDRVAAATNRISALERINLAREARSSVTLEDYRPNPFNDHELLAEQELAGAAIFDLSTTTLALLAPTGHCADCENGNHPDLGDEAMDEFVQTWVAPKPGVGSLDDEVFKVQLHRAAKMIAEARAKMDAAEFVLADVLEGLLP